MRLSHRRMFAGSVAIAALTVCSLAPASLAGPLDPPTGPVASTGKTLDEVFAAASATGAPSSDFAAPSRNVIVMTATGGAGPILGEDTLFGMPDVIRVHRVEHLVEIPTDPATGLPTGQRQHGRFRAFKIVDRSTPLLERALTTNERLAEVKFQFFRINPATALPEHYYTITLGDAQVVGVRLHSREAGADAMTHEEEVSFVYNSITWTFVGGAEHTDVLSAP